MSETKPQTLSGVAETLLITLYLRAMESQRPDALIKDEKAVALVTQMSYDFARVRQIPLSTARWARPTSPHDCLRGWHAACHQTIRSRKTLGYAVAVRSRFSTHRVANNA
jgi:O-methyltransferase involved in polyketide biosynthesis